MSPRLRAEAVDEVNIIHTNFTRLLSSLVNSRRRAAAEIAMELDEAKNELAEVRQQADEQRKDFEQQLEAQAELIARLQQERAAADG